MSGMGSWNDFSFLFLIDLWDGNDGEKTTVQSDDVISN